MQLNETVTIINRSGKIIGNGKHIVNIFKEAKAAYRDKKAAIKADRAAAAAAAAANELRPGIRKAHTFDVRSRGPSAYDYAPEALYDHYADDQVYEDVSGARRISHHHQDDFVDQHDDDYYLEREYDHGRPSVVDDARSQATSRRSHTTHRSKRSHVSSASKHSSASSRSALTESNLRTLTRVSAVTPSTAPSAYRSPYPDSAPRDMVLSRPTLVHSATAPLLSGANGTGSERLSSALSDLTIRPPAPVPASAPPSAFALSAPTTPSSKKNKEIDMNLAYGEMPPDLASRTDLGPATPAEEAAFAHADEVRREEQARKLMARIDALLDEAECVQHTAAATIDHLQRQPEAAAAVALMLAELSTLLKAMSPGFLSVVKGGFPAVFALLASPQFLIGVGVAVGVTVIFFGGWKIVKRVQAAQALVAEKEASRMAFAAGPPLPQQAPSQYYHQQQPVDAQRSSAFRGGEGYAPSGSGSYDDALVLEEELSTIETWRRGITPYGDDGDDLFDDHDQESVDLELITPHAAQSVRGGDAMSIRTTRTHKSHKSHKSHASHRSHRSSSGNDNGEDARSIAPTERSRRTTRSKASTSVSAATGKTHARSSHLRAIEDGSRDAENTLDAVLRSSSGSSVSGGASPRESMLSGVSASSSNSKKPTMLKALFKKKKEREEQAVSVMV